MTPSTLRSFGSTEHLKLEPGERQIARAFLMQFMEQHPLRHRSILGGIAGVFTAPLRALRFQPAVALCTVVTLIVAGSGGMLAAAESALPGDALYNVKVNVTGELIAMLLPEGEWEGSWHVERVERRLEEAEHLALEEELTEETGELLVTLLEEHLSDAAGESAELLLESDPGGLDIGLALQASLDVHEKFLTSLEKSRPQSRRHLRPLVLAVRAAQKEVAAMRIEAREIAPKFPEEIVEEEVTESQQEAALLQEEIADLPLEREIREEIEGELAAVETTLDQAAQALEQGKTAEAFLLSQDAQYLTEGVDASVEIVEDVLEGF